jgi:hypothetical protein
MKIDIKDLEKLKKIDDPEINKLINELNVENIEENKAIEFMELLYEKSNEYLSNPGYNETEESSLLERIADNIYEQTK